MTEISRRHDFSKSVFEAKSSQWSCMVMIAKFGAEEIEK